MIHTIPIKKKVVKPRKKLSLGKTEFIINHFELKKGDVEMKPEELDEHLRNNFEEEVFIDISEFDKHFLKTRGMTNEYNHYCNERKLANMHHSIQNLEENDIAAKKDELAWLEAFKEFTINKFISPHYNPSKRIPGKCWIDDGSDTDNDSENESDNDSDNYSDNEKK